MQVTETIGPVGLFGKVPAQGDFLRLNASDAVAQALARWLEDGNEALYRAGTGLAPRPIDFLFREPSGDRALVGALGPGADKVGRSFPLAIFVPVALRSLAGAFPLVPALYRSFLDAAGVLMVAASTLTPPQIAERLRQLPLPGPGDAEAARVWAGCAAGERVRDLQTRLFNEPPEGQHYYAFRTFLVGCQTTRGKDQGQADVTIDCPCAVETDVWIWLELARRILGPLAPPSFFWRVGDSPILALSVGAPPPAVLPFLSAVPRENQKIWPLRTKRAPAIDVARKALSAAQLATLDHPDATAEDLVTSMSRP